VARIKPIQAMDYLSLSRDSFDVWCDAVKITSYKYEFSNRTYFISGEFYALADKNEIEKIKEIHGENWHNYYSKYTDVSPFITDNQLKEQEVRPTHYQPKSADVANFIKGLKN